MAEVGRPSILDKELFSKIKQCILNGNDLRNTAKICEINETTLYNWTADNYLNITDKIEGWRRDRKLKLAENNLEAILCLGVSDKDSLKVVSDITKFTLETLNKKDYSKRNEMTGADGRDLPTPIIKLETNAIQRNNSNEEDTEPNKED